MTQREKILAFGVGGTLLVVGFQLALNRYRSAIDARRAQVAALDQQVLEANTTLLQGAHADRMMGEYIVRSLPSDAELARADYLGWLYEVVELAGLRGPQVDSLNPAPEGDLFLRHGFRVRGKADAVGWLELLHLFYSRDYLHRIDNLTINRLPDGDLDVTLNIQAVGLNAAPEDLEIPNDMSLLVGSFDSYADPILNRNFFSPPNQPPRFTGSSRLTVNVGESARVNVTAEDPEKSRIRYSLVGDAPEGLELDPESGSIRWRPEEVGTHRITVRATDGGFPAKSAEQTLELAVVEPPPPAREPDPEPAFDDATQTVLTALVQGGGDWTAWMNVRTRGQTLKLRPGDEFKIGKLSGTVVDVNARYVTLEIDGKRFELRPSGNLAEAARKANDGPL